MSLLQRIKDIHPGAWIAAFFFVLIAFNVAFFVIAASHDVQLVEIGDTHVKKQSVDAVEPSLLAPTDGRQPRGGDIR